MSYKYTKEAFRKLINMDDFTVEFTSSPIDIQELSNLGIDGLNERCVDDVVDQGYLIEDLTLTADSIVDGEVVVKITGHAETWLAEAFPEEEKSDEPRGGITMALNHFTVNIYVPDTSGEGDPPSIETYRVETTMTSKEFKDARDKIIKTASDDTDFVVDMTMLGCKFSRPETEVIDVFL